MDRFVWIVGAFLVVAPHLNTGLLSDYKICGDPECASPMSRVQAIKDHRGKDCRFLSFRHGDTIFVYHKLTGKREDLWAGSIDKQFGYFPNDAVREEQIYATTEKVVETQKSDFFCMDEFGYPIDTSDLDSDDDDDQKLQTQESETIQLNPNTQDTNAEGLLTFTDPSTQSAEAQEAKAEENKNLSEVEEPHEEAHKTSTQEEQGGSPSSSWLGSSVTGWLGLSTEEKSGNLKEEENENELKETKGDASLASSVTGWLGFGGDRKPDTKESVQQEDSVTSTMTDWFGFGGEKKLEAPQNEQNEEQEPEPTETFRSRRMSLDLGDRELFKEEKTDMGTLDWLGRGLSSRLGFGKTNQDPGQEISGGEGDKEKERSSSWMDVGIGGILGLRSENTGVDESKESGTEETEEEKSLKQPTENVGKSGSMVSLTDGLMTETSNESPEPTHSPPPEPVRADSKENDVDEVTDASGILDAEAGLRVDHTDVSPQAVAETSSETDDNMLEDDNKVDENISEGTQVKVSQTLDFVGNKNGNTKESEEDENNTSYVKNVITQSDSSLGPDRSFDETSSNSMNQSEDRVEEKGQTPRNIAGSEEEDRAEITDTVLLLEKSSNMLGKSTARGEEELFKEATDLSQTDIFTTQTEESGGRISDAEEHKEQGQLLSTLEERNEDIPDESFPPPIAETSGSHLNTPSITDDDVETESHRGELRQEEQTQPVAAESPHSGRKIKERFHRNPSEEKRGTILTNTTIRNVNHTSGSPHSLTDADKLKETLSNQNEETEKETLVFKEDVLNISNPKLHLGPETETEKSGDGRNEETTEKKERGKEEKKWEVKDGSDEVKTEEQREVKDLNKTETKKVDRTLKEEEEEKEDDSKEESEVERAGEEGVESKKERRQEVEELQKEEKQVPELPEKEKQVRVEGFKESEEANEKEKTEEEKEVQDRPLENIQSDTGRTDLQSKEEDTSDVENLAPPVTDVATESESQEMEEKKREQTGRKGFEKIKDVNVEETIEKQQKKHEEDGSLKTSDQIFSEEAKGVGGNSEDGGRSAAASTAWAAEQDENKVRERQVKGKASNNAVRESHGSEEQTRKTDDTTDHSESQHSEGAELSAQTHDPHERQAQQSEPTLTEDPVETSDPPGATETENGGTFGLFKNALGFFSQTASTTSTGSTPIFNTNSAETSQPQASLSPEQEPESTTGFHQAPGTDTVPPTELLLPVSTENPHPTASSTTETPPKTKILTRHYKNLLTYMSIDETDVLLELFGRHKLQYLDYILAGSETVSAADESILSDIERFLHHHVETLVAPSMRLTDAPQEDKDKTRSLIALQKLDMLLKTVKDTFSTGISDVSKHQDEHSCATCSTQDEEKKQISQDSLVAEDRHIHRDERMRVEKDGSVEEKRHVDRERRDKGSEKEGASQEGLEKQMLDFIDGMKHKGVLTWQVVSSLPDDMKPGPDLYGVPWEPVIITGLVGLVTFLLFTCRCYSSVKSRMYRNKEHWMSEQIAQLLDEKCKVLETLSQCQQEYDDLENSLRDSGVLAQAQTTEHLEAQVRQLQDTEKELERDLDQLKDQLDQQREHREEQERRIAMLEESIQTFEEETKDLQSQEEQAQTTLKIYDMNSDRLQRNLETEREENTVLQESNTQLRQQVEGWAERVSELEAEMQRCEVAHNAMLQDVANKDKRIMSLTDRLLRMKGWDSELEGEDGGKGREKEATNGTGGADVTDTHLQKVQKLIYAAKLNADLKSVDEDKDRVFAKLNDEIKAKEDLQVSIQELEHEKLSLQSDSKHFSDEVERLQQKLHIMTEMYQENELKLHRMLTVEEKERLQKEEKLNKADKNIAMALEELNNYRKRAEEMEEELEKTKQSYQTQISSHEKKAHNNWLAARAAERELGDIRRENALLRQKLTDTQFKLDSLDKDPYALHSLARPLPFRAERSPYGPSPLGRPSSETRAFLSPPTLMDGPPARLSPRVPCGPVEPPGGQGDMERSGGPHSDSSSNSPTWERDRRGPPPGLQGGMFPEPGGPLFRRPPPAALGLLPPPGSFPPRGLPPVPHPADMADGSFRENRLGPGDQELRLSGPGDQRTLPESDPRIGGPFPPGPPMIPVDGPFPRRAPYGPPPPPDFYPPRGPGIHPLMPRWPPPSQRMMLPPHLHPPGGPPFPPPSHPNMPPYGAPMGPPPPDGPPPSLLPHQPLPSPPHSQSSQENVPSPEDAI